ncbi:hypothetical protein F503_00786 [Ophiostoma piceae UAMH 11346]|uniref:Uncharacterized protein n=1 Tax=Ophiostoma piceae (strain UAMH 11346) TaxID=1262450 RepID=S3CN86_OPHP1|nr:hypothetical protein F503_00786 [Ophiostoma piceae UAMH 11346]
MASRLPSPGSALPTSSSSLLASNTSPQRPMNSSSPKAAENSSTISPAAQVGVALSVVLFVLLLGGIGLWATAQVQKKGKEQSTPLVGQRRPH